MNYIVLDLEWNQGQERSPDKPLFEIIEIGAVKLDAFFQIREGYQSLIKPQIYSTMNRVTKELVNLEMRDLKDARSFPEVAREFLDWCGQDCRFCIWGSQDLTEFQRNMDFYGITPISTGPLKYYDVQKLYSLYCGNDKMRSSLSKAVEAEQLLEKEVPFHRAFGDAYYTARIFRKIAGGDILKRISFDLYHIPASGKEQIFWRFEDYTKFISRGFGERAELMEDKQVTCMRCIYCDKALRKKVDWFTTNGGKHYYTVAKCSEHGLMKGKLRVRKSKDELYYVVKTVKHIKEAEATTILAKKRPSAE